MSSTQISLMFGRLRLFKLGFPRWCHHQSHHRGEEKEGNCLAHRSFWPRRERSTSRRWVIQQMRLSSGCQAVAQEFICGLSRKIPDPGWTPRRYVQLSAEGIRTTVTGIVTVAQGLIAAKAGATYVAPYVNWVDNIERSRHRGLWLNCSPRWRNMILPARFWPRV